VSYLGAYFMARSINGRIFTNNVHCSNETVPIFDLPVINNLGPVTTGSILMGFQYTGIDCGPIENIPPNKNTGNASLVALLTSIWSHFFSSFFPVVVRHPQPPQRRPPQSAEHELVL